MTKPAGSTMKVPGDLLVDTPYALSFRLLEPVPETSRRLLLLLHGVGGVETQLAALGPHDLRLHDAGRELTPAMAGDVLAWIAQLPQR